MLFGQMRERKKHLRAEECRRYLSAVMKLPPSDFGRIRYSDRDCGTVKYSSRGVADIADFAQLERLEKTERPGRTVDTQTSYNAAAIEKLIKNRNASANSARISADLARLVNLSFVETVILYQQEKGLRDAAIYKAALMDRRLYSKMMCDRKYQPSKDTALAIVFALRLSLPRANDLLEKAGFTLSHSIQRDVILEYCLLKKLYNLITVNELLDELGERPLGRA